MDGFSKINLNQNLNSNQIKNNGAYSNLSSMNTTQNDKDSFHTQEHQAPPFSPERTDHANSSKYKKSDMTAHGGLGKSLIVAN